MEMVGQYGLNMFLGAGFSAYAKNNENEKLPLGNKICEQLIKTFEVENHRNLNLSQVCQKIKSRNKDALNMFLRNKYKVKEFDSDYLKIYKLPLKNIFTINIDDLIEKIYSDANATIDISDVKINGLIDKNNIVNLYKLHGSVTYPVDTRLSFTEKELHDLFIIDHTLFNAVTYKLAACPTIFWGTSLYDSNSIQLLCNAETINSLKMPKWIVVYPEGNYNDLIEDLKELDFNIIVADTKELINYLYNMPFVNKNEGNPYIYEKYRNAFPNNFITKELIKKAPVRPISDFFFGAEPQISDILSKSLVRTSYFNKIYDTILKFNVTLITGIPGCGKSTLLMQLAFASEISGRKFWFNNMIEAEANRLVNLVKHDNNVIVFLDNLYNNLDAFSVLKQCNNIKIVTTERAINYEFIKKSLNITINSIIDVSNLESSDIQSICQSMNRESYAALEMLKKNQNVSLLEIVFFVYKSITVKSRVKEYILSLEHYKDTILKIDLLELYVLVNYISYCGIPASMDMLIFYFSENKVNYDEIMYAIKKMNSIIVDVDVAEKYLSTSQDYVSMRSKLYGEISINVISRKTLCYVLNKFLKNVNPMIIYRYDIFKKRAYDADITNRAFITEEGITYYENVLTQNTSPYIRHQYALFLQRKGDITKAWEQIDKAYSDCNKKIFTIANTHAMIMFEKNIDVKLNNEKEITDLKEILSRTFETLKYCIDKDMRVNYHVLIYSRNAVKYYEKFGIDDKGRDYLEFAGKQLNGIMNSRDYIYGRLYSELKSLYNEIKGILKIAD
ncbi:energy-coupling factor transporter ATP-binding protein EcfA2 [Anaerotaenia torta]|uniref:SIR2 family protein n=1 Tax=Anaerotaenia torta TaxID=433293 RepID=UPI003D25F67E